jgi:Zn-dependent protease with chaperone function
VTRRPGRTALALAPPLLLFVAFGVARVTAPVSALGLLFDDPRDFAIAAALTSILGALLLMSRPVELMVSRVIAGATSEPDPSQRERLERLLATVSICARVDPERLVVRVQDHIGVNASAGAGHLLFVTRGALALPDDRLEAILAHELGHHRGLHPLLAAVIWWLRLPGAGLAAVYRLLRRAVGRLGERLGRLGRLLAIPLVILLLVWQVVVMWLFYVAELLAMRAVRISEYEADAAAASWGYAVPLISTYRELISRESEPPGRLARLMADHPPLPKRIVRLEGHLAEARLAAGRERAPEATGTAG